MLPPSLGTTTMDNNSTSSLSLATQQQQQHQQTSQHHQSAFFPNNKSTSSAFSSSSSSSSSSSISTNSFPTVPFNSSSIKNFFNKTLAKVTQTTNLIEFTAEYSSAFANSTLASSSFNSSLNSYGIAAGLYDDGGVVDNRTSEAASISGGGGGGSVVEVSSDFDSYAAAADMAVATLSNGSHHLETTTAFPTTAQTVATFIAGNKNRATTIIVYPTVSPESIVIPIVSCIFGFPILAFIVICCLRHRAKMARERDRRRNYDMQDHAVSLVRFSPIHRLNYRSARAISLRPERSLSQGFTSLELDTVVEERCSDVEQTQTEILNSESPMESSATTCKISFSSS